jgi:hypothetical protein
MSFDRETIALLADRLLEGRATEEDVRALEEHAQSHAARQFLAEYLLLTGELHWLGGVCSLGDKRRPTIQSDRQDRLKTRQVLEGLSQPNLPLSKIFARAMLPLVVAGAVCVALLSVWLSRGERGQLQKETQLPIMASLAQSYFSDVEGTGDVVMPGRWVYLRKGVAQWRLSGGASLIVQAPARFCLGESGEVELTSGAIFVRTEGSPHPLRVITPHAYCVDRGTAFGVWNRSTQTEVHVLQGKVEITARLASHGSRCIGEGDAVVCDDHGQIEKVPCRPERFCQMVPRAKTVAAYRAAAFSNPRLWLYAAFESPAYEGKWLSALGPNDFRPVLMYGTMTRLEIEHVVGFEPQSKAVKLIRGAYSGDTVGVGLQTTEPIAFPQSMTVEMIVRFDGWTMSQTDTLGCLLSAWQDQRRCGVLLGVVPVNRRDNPQNAKLVHLLDGASPWTETQGELVRGCWHYLVATFERNGTMTRVSTWLANLSERGPLVCVMRDGSVPGNPADGYLGLGKGFDAGMSHAYPFPGAIDELAIYNGVLGEDEIRSHLEHLIDIEDQAEVFPLPEKP